MINQKICRVLVVDDSALIREIISDVIKQSDGLELAGTARDGMDALAKIKRLKPDVVTLDIQMPRLNGLQTLEKILEDDPVPVVMVSALAQRDADVTLQALENGAIDYIPKPDRVSSEASDFADLLQHKLRTAASTDVRRVLKVRKARNERRQASGATMTSRSVSRPVNSVASKRYAQCCVALGISTGGPPALASLFESLQPPMPPIVIVQHMPQQFTGPFSARLNSLSQITVKEAADGDVLTPDHAYVAPGGRHLQLMKFGGTVRTKIRDGEPVSGHKPSVDVMMNDAAQIFGRKCLGIIMTGMGRDGADGCGAIRAAGGEVLGQDQETSDVYGMNKVAYIEGHVDSQFALDVAPAVITRKVRQMFGEPSVSAR